MEIKKEIIGGVCPLQGLLSGWPCTFSLSIVIACCPLWTAAHRAVDKEEDGHRIVSSYFYRTKLQMKSFCMVRSCLLLVECTFFSSNALWVDLFNDVIPLSGCPQGQRTGGMQSKLNQIFKLFFLILSNFVLGGKQRLPILMICK